MQKKHWVNTDFYLPLAANIRLSDDKKVPKGRNLCNTDKKEKNKLRRSGINVEHRTPINARPPFAGMMKLGKTKLRNSVFHAKGR